MTYSFIHLLVNIYRKGEIMKNFKCLLSLLLAMTLLVGCQSSTSGKANEEFSQYIDELVVKLANEEASILSLNVEHPENYGIEEDDDEDEFTYPSLEEFQESVKHYEEYQKELKEFDYEKLDDDNKIIYDLLNYQYDDAIKSKDLYYLLYEPFDVSSGLHTQLPLYILTIEFNEQDDVDDMLELLEKIDEIFAEDLRLEKERQAAGYGMSKSYVKKVLQQVDDFLKADHDEIIKAAQKKINEVTFMNDQQKADTNAQIKKAYQEKVIPAYKTVSKELKNMDIKVEDEYASLADYQNGKKYYELLVYEATGMSVEDFRKSLEERISKSTTKLATLMIKYPDLDETDLENIEYTDCKNVTEQLQAFEKAVQESGDFPKISPLKYQMDIIPKDLQPMFQFAAAYMVSPVDAVDVNERMVLNGDYKQEDFTTIAHEGYPGHMYQNNYMKEKKFHILRYALRDDAYAEGWATYVEKVVSEYAKDKGMAELMNVNAEVSYAAIMWLDIQIHYDNIGYDEAMDVLSSLFGISGDDAQEQYMQLLTMPGVFLAYYGNYFEMKDLKESLNLSSDLEFNQKYLDYSGLPITLIKKYEEK